MATIATTFLEEDLDTSSTPFKIANNNTAIAGGAVGLDYITINSGVIGTEVASTIEDITLTGDIGDYKFKQGFGSNLEIYNGSNELVMSLTDVEGKNLTFDNSATTALKYGADGIISVGEINITTTAAVLDTTAPTLSSSSPADDSATMAIGNNIVLTMSETVKAGTGNITICNASGDSVIEAIDVTSDLVTFSGSTVTINPTNDLTASTSYYVKIDATAITDVAGNAYEGIDDKTTFSFATPAVATTIEELQTVIDGSDTSVTIANTMDVTAKDLSQFTVGITIENSDDTTPITVTMTAGQVDTLAGLITKGSDDLVVVAADVTGEDMSALTLTDADALILTTAKDYTMTAAQANVAQIGTDGTAGDVADDDGTMTVSANATGEDLATKLTATGVDSIILTTDKDYAMTSAQANIAKIGTDGTAGALSDDGAMTVVAGATGEDLATTLSATGLDAIQLTDAQAYSMTIAQANISQDSDASVGTVSKATVAITVADSTDLATKKWVSVATLKHN